jgi:predicted ATPase/DNA-binding XRE family transcriptional regulator
MLIPRDAIGPSLRRKRKELDLTQAELGRLVGCTGEMIRKIESGTRKPSKQLTELLALRLEELAAQRDAEGAYGFGGPIAPPLKFERPLGNLPEPVTPLVGRRKALSDLEQILLGEARLLTLTGSPGIGKTRLALALAHRVRAKFHDGAYMVDLAPLMTSGDVAPAVISVLRIREEPGRSHLETLGSYLWDKQLLLFFDNFEHLLDAGFQLGDLLSAASHLKILTTSREALRLYGENLFEVPPLTVPHPQNLPDLHRLSMYEGIRLFGARARAIRPDFKVTEENAGSVVAVCHRLEGLPLAIELAAARIGSVPLHQMPEKLDSSLTLLTEGARDLPHRQRTLRSAIEWSSELLQDQEKTLFRRLGVFVGGCTLRAIERVCGLSDWTHSLVDKSLVRQESGVAGEPRFTMLETVLEYAREKLAEANAGSEEEAVRHRHGLYFMSLAEEADREIRGPRQLEWLDRLEKEQNNVRAALAWLRKQATGGSVGGSPVPERLEVEPAEIALRLVGSLSRYWLLRDDFSEGREQLRSILDLETNASEPLDLRVLRARALLGESVLASRQDDVDLAARLNQEALAISRAVGDKHGVACALLSWASCGSVTDFDERLRMLEESRRILEKLEEVWDLARVVFQIGCIAEWQSDYQKAKPLFLEAVSLFEQTGDPLTIAHSLNNLGMTLAYTGDYAAAYSSLQRSLALHEGARNRWGKAMSLRCLVRTSWQHRTPTDMRSLSEEALAIWRDVGAMFFAAESLLDLARMALIEGDLREAERCLDESLNLLRTRSPDAYLEATVLCFKGHLAKRLGDECKAAELYRDSLLVKYPQKPSKNWVQSSLSNALAALAGIGHVHGVRAATLAGAAQALREATPQALAYDERLAYEQNLAAARDKAIDQSDWQEAWAEGRAMSMEGAINYALDGV